MRPAAGKSVVVEGRTLDLTNLEKPFWPEDGFSKAHFIAYLRAVAPWLLPHLRGRPLVVTRYPNGIHGESFYQKDTPDHAPDWIPTWRYWAEDSGRWIRFTLCEDLPTLIWLANQACLEIHPWLSTVAQPDRPDLAVIDLDPAEPAGFAEARQVSFLVRDLLDTLGLRGYPKLSGATGIHVYVPISPRYGYRQVAAFVRECGRLLLRLAPDRITLERAVHRRTGKVYVDYLQNVRGKTLVSVYCPRPLPGAPVSCPVTWEELERVTPDAFTLASVPPRLARLGDLFAPVLTDRQGLEDAFRRLNLPPGGGV